MMRIRVRGEDGHAGDVGSPPTVGRLRDRPWCPPRGSAPGGATGSRRRN